MVSTFQRFVIERFHCIPKVHPVYGMYLRTLHMYMHIRMYVGKRVIWLGDILWLLQWEPLPIEISLHQMFRQLTATLVSATFIPWSVIRTADQGSS